MIHKDCKLKNPNSSFYIKQRIQHHINRELRKISYKYLLRGSLQYLEYRTWNGRNSMEVGINNRSVYPNNKERTFQGRLFYKHTALQCTFYEAQTWGVHCSLLEWEWSLHLRIMHTVGLALHPRTCVLSELDRSMVGYSACTLPDP